MIFLVHNQKLNGGGAKRVHGMNGGGGWGWSWCEWGGHGKAAPTTPKFQHSRHFIMLLLLLLLLWLLLLLLHFYFVKHLITLLLSQGSINYLLFITSKYVYIQLLCLTFMNIQL